MHSVFSRACLGLGILFLSQAAFPQNISSVVGGLNSTPTALSPLSVFWNPAVLGMIPSHQIDVNLGVLTGWLIYDRKGSDPNTGDYYPSTSTLGVAPSFQFGASSPLGTQNFRFGYATYFPSGAMAEFSPEGSQRYDLISGYLIPWHHQFTAAWRINSKLSVALSGIGSISFFSTELDVDLGALMKAVLNSEDLPMEHPALAARAQVPRTWAPGIGGSAGIYWRPTYQFSAGVSAYTPVNYKFAGELKLNTPEMASLVGAGLPALGIDSQLTNQIEAKSSLPAFIQGGIKYQHFGYWGQEYFFRYVFSSFEKSIGIQVKRSAVTEVSNLNIEGTTMDDSFMVGMLQSFPLWTGFTPAIYGAYSKSGSPESDMAITRADFDSLLLGAVLQYQAKTKIKIGGEYLHSFMLERHATKTPTSESRFFQRPSTQGKYRAGMDRVGLTVKYAF